MDVSEILYRKTLAQDVFDRRWSLDGLKARIKVRDLYLCWSLHSGVGIVWSTTTQTRINAQSMNHCCHFLR